MGFVNEWMTPADVEKYDIERIDERLFTRTRSWTVDRERDIYLRYITSGREDACNLSVWTFYWHGELLELRLELLGCSEGRGGPGWARWKVTRLDLFGALKRRRAEIVSDLKDALTAYKDGGVYATKTTFDVTLEF